MKTMKIDSTILANLNVSLKRRIKREKVKKLLLRYNNFLN